MTAGAPPEHFETVVERLVESGEIKVWKAQEIIAQLGTKPAALDQGVRKSAEGRGYGKVILLGACSCVWFARHSCANLPLGTFDYPSVAANGRHFGCAKVGRRDHAP